MSYQILLKQNLHGDEILYVVKYSDTRNFSFIFTEEQTQETCCIRYSSSIGEQD